MSLLDLLIGRPLPSEAARGEKISAQVGVPVFGLDALSSAAYGPEAALTLLLPLGLAGVRYILPISLSIAALLLIVFFSYRQTIAAYPGGGGSYIVARANLGAGAGVLAAAALVIDYVLNVAVGISAGVGALVSAAPALQPHVLALCLAILVLITLFNLRGLREAGLAFIVPTYLFIGSMLAMIAVGVIRALLAGGHPRPIVAPPAAPAAIAAVGLWILLRAFASGCTALTGIEAVSNGVQAFREPVVQNAQRTMGMIVGVLALMLGGIAYLVHAYRIAATIPGGPGYQSVLSMLFAAVVGRGLFYYVAMAAILAVLALSANTSFADFPRVCHILAEDGYLPRFFGNTGRRLVYTPGILVLAAFAAVLLWFFGGITDRLIPLFAIGAFMAFTLSQAGMVRHWRQRQDAPRGALLVNAVGALATGVTVVVVLVTKFAAGAWIVVAVVPLLVATMFTVRRHYARAARLIASDRPVDLAGLQAPLAVLVLQDWNRVSARAVRIAYSISRQVHAVHIATADPGSANPDLRAAGAIRESSPQPFRQAWQQYVVAPARAAGLPEPELTLIPSPYRLVIRPLRDHVLQIANRYPERQIAVIIPELVTVRWYQWFLHNQMAMGLKAMLLLAGDERISVLNVPWYLRG